ncbi:stalk domain-containing protein [Brevibacillus dissolubilis]|uniref:stalk domain-containing protein n=1 Tax=Brevibacillus dissolubilis TaxID=1844116 RepID=UPI0011171359|nr:stalk domain-containing protein [Brevibacillus dissolubilis]
MAGGKGNKPYHFVSKLFGVLVTSTLLGMASGEVASAATVAPGPVISFMIDRKGIATDTQPVIRNSRMLVPIRAISENTGDQIAYDSETDQVTIETKDQEIILTINDKTAKVNGESVTLEAAPILLYNRTYLPIRFVSETLGYQVEWDNISRVASIYTRTKTDKHLVAAGETLSLISKQYGVPVELIKQENGLTDDMIMVGSNLVIPVLGGASESSESKIQSTQSPTASAEVAKYGATLAPKLKSQKSYFPIAADSWYEPFYNTYGDGRSYNGNSTAARQHEGIDIVAKKGTPVYAAASGRINRIGWNQFGGWRINITDHTGNYKFYYAHLDAYAPALRTGTYVKAGQLIGFVGDSGYGVKGTEGKFVSHLHFGLYYAKNDRPVNPYNYLKYIESNKVV